METWDRLGQIDFRQTCNQYVWALDILNLAPVIQRKNIFVFTLKKNFLSFYD